MIANVVGIGEMQFDQVWCVLNDREEAPVMETVAARWLLQPKAGLLWLELYHLGNNFVLDEDPLFIPKLLRFFHL